MSNLHIHGQPLKINCHKGTYFTGLGDTVLLAWLAEGARGSDRPIQLVADGQRALMLQCLGLGDVVTTDETGALIPSDLYLDELRDGGNKPRIEYVRNFCGIKTEPKRPTPNIPSTYLEWAANEKRNICFEGQPLILLFPETHWTPRRWPTNLWIDLAWQLENIRQKPLIMMEREHADFGNVPRRYWGYNLAQVMALMSVADIVVANDSMPAHLAGTLGKKTIALLGPTKPTVFSHIDNVVPVQNDKLSCVGCHFKGGINGFRAACDQGCMSLYSLTVDEVLAEIGVLL